MVTGDGVQFLSSNAQDFIEDHADRTPIHAGESIPEQ